jgi:serine/threonine-protein kinase
VGEDTVKLGDFGAAKLESSTAPSETQHGQVFGTPHYMSPEHARGLATDRRTDIYALGCVLFEMLTGAVPYDGATPFDVLTQHIHNPIPAIESPRGPLPDAVEKLIVRAMAKRIEERYQTAAELAVDLERAATALARPGWRRWLPS